MNLPAPVTESEKYRALPWSIAHVALNNFFYIWTFGGSIFILFLNELGLPKDQIGLMLSFFPFAGLLALGTGAAITRFGRKRMYLLGYGIRKPIMASLIGLPWMLAHLGFSASVLYLYGVMVTVAILRALAETAYFPWLQEFVPNAVRGKYSAINTILTTLTALIALGIASLVLERGTGLARYMLLIGLGSGIGLFAVGLMAFVPGGQPLRPAERARAPLANLGQALRDHNFSYFLAGMGCYSVGAYMLASFLPLYLKEKIGLESSTVVALDMAVMFGSAFGSVLAGMLADRLGSRPVMMPGLALSVLIPAGWLLMGPGVPQVIVWSGLLYFAYGAVSSIASIGAIRLLFNAVIPVEKNTEYTAIYYAWAGFSGGITPLAAGWLLQFLAAWQVNFGSWALGAFQLLFLLSLLGFAASTYFYGKVKPDGRYSTRTAIRQLFKKGKETVIHLWQTDIPHFRADFSADIPAIEPYLLPGDAPRPVVIVLPGGGYNHRAAHEGEPIARWLNEIGLSAFVLTYRVAPYRHPVPLLDVQRAIRTVRCRASEFGVDAQRIGVLGFSAGGHLTSTAGTHFDAGDPTAADPVERVSSRPDALVLCYPVISFGEYRHQGSCTTLLGENPPQEMIDLLSNEKQVTPQTPPTFLWHTANDGGVPVENSLLFAAALSRHKVPFDLHIFADGPHGVGLALDRPALAAWTQLCAAWFKELGWI